MAAAALPPIPRVFCTMGHGCEIVPDQEGPLPVAIETFEVPAGCTFVTLEVVGILSGDLPKILVAFRDPMWQKALRYPDNDIIREILTEYCDIGGDKPNHISSVIRVRNAGERFTNTHIDLWCPIAGHIFKSGTYELGNVPTDEPIVQQMTPEELALYNSNSLTPAALSPERRAQIYRGSIFPTVDQINAGAQTGYRYIDLMTNYLGPGVYYHFACRVPCDMPDYDPQFNFNAHFRQAAEAWPQASAANAPAAAAPHFNDTMEQVLAYYNRHSRKKPVINRMQQLSINRVRRLGKLNQVGKHPSLIKRNPGSMFEIWSQWNDHYISVPSKIHEWRNRIKAALYSIIPLHLHPIRDITEWSVDSGGRLCDVCGDNIYRTHHCRQDGYDECTMCYFNRYANPVSSASSAARPAASASASRYLAPSAAASASASRHSVPDNDNDDVPVRQGGRRTKRKIHRKKSNKRTHKRK